MKRLEPVSRFYRYLRELSGMLSMAEAYIEIRCNGCAATFASDG